MRKTQLSCAIVAALASTSLAAQDTGAPAKLETIEVTATKRSESIQDVPVAVSALDGKALENLGIDNFQDYVEFYLTLYSGDGPRPKRNLHSRRCYHPIKYYPFIGPSASAVCRFLS